MKKTILIPMILVCLLAFSHLIIFAEGGNGANLGSTGSNVVTIREVMVPNLVGRSLEESKRILDDLGLSYNINKIYVKNPSSSVKSQYPSSDTYLRDDLKVNLYVEEIRTKEKVKWLQESLKIAGFYTSRDGLYGNNTANKLNEFKKSEVSLLNDYEFNTDTEKVLEDIRRDKLAPNHDTNMVLVNKKYYIPSDYKPEKIVVADVKSFKDINISSQIKEPLENMFRDAKKAGFDLYLLSGYRSYDYQEMLFSRKVKAVGFDKAETVVAVPGESEHQTGLAVDVSCKSIQFGLNNKLEDTKEFEWLINNSYKYGFILRYPKGKSDITGYIYEPWHYRYIGDVEIAKYIMDNKLTFEEYNEKIEKERKEAEQKKIEKEMLNNKSYDDKTSDANDNSEDETVVID